MWPVATALDSTGLDCELWDPTILSSSPGSATYWLWNLGQVIQHLWALFPPLWSGDNNSTHLAELLRGLTKMLHVKKLMPSEPPGKWVGSEGHSCDLTPGLAGPRPAPCSPPSLPQVPDAPGDVGGGDPRGTRSIRKRKRMFSLTSSENKGRQYYSCLEMQKQNKA